MLIKKILNKKPFFVVGHRGAKGLAPENTLLSIKIAIELGVDIVEIDVRKTKDGKIDSFAGPYFQKSSRSGY